MKNLHYLFIVCLLVFSCSKTDETTEELFVPDPTIISEYHTLGYSGNTLSKHTFDENGRLFKYINILNDYYVEFEYDVDNKLSVITKKDLNDIIIGEQITILYDVNSRVINLDNRVFTYNETDNSYYEDSSFYMDDTGTFNGELYEAYGYRYYKVNTENNFTSTICFSIVGDRTTNIATNEVISEYEYNSWGWGISFKDNNLWSNRSLDFTGSVIFDYDTLTNPLQFENSNFKDISIFFHPENLNPNFYTDVLLAMLPTLSANNKIKWTDSSPENISYSYEFNALELPLQSTYQYFYGETPEGNAFINAKYYYQGDVIPE